MPVPIALMHFKEKSLGDPNKGGLNSTAMFINGHLRVISAGRLELLLPLKNVASRHVSSLVPAQTTLEKSSTVRRQQRTISG